MQMYKKAIKTLALATTLLIVFIEDYYDQHNIFFKSKN